MRNLVMATVIAAMTAGSAPIMTAAQTPERVNQCFQSRDWQGWRALNANTMYINVQFHHIYRIDFAGECPEILWPDARLVTHIHGSTEICSPLDLDLKVSDGNGFATPCIVSKMTLLTPAVAAAIPAKYRP
jgi:hypothetical protein